MNVNNQNICSFNNSLYINNRNCEKIVILVRYM